jgi:hypothetical protein
MCTSRVLFGQDEPAERSYLAGELACRGGGGRKPWKSETGSEFS